MAAKRYIREFPYPKKQGMRSARPRGNNSSPWVLPEGFLNSQNELSKHGSDQNIGSKKRVFTEGGNSTSIVPKKELKLMTNSCQYDNVELQGTKTDIGEGIDPKSRGKRSIQPRGEKPASFVSLDGLHRFERELKKHVNDQIGLASITVQKVKENNDDAVEQAIAPMVLTLAEVKGVIGNADKNTCVPTTNTLEVRESNKQDVIATEQMDVVMTDTTYEFMVSNGTGTKCVVQDSDLWTNTLADLNLSNGASINAAQTAVLTSDVVYSQQGKRNIEDVQPTIFPDLNLDTGAVDSDISGAESLASVYGLSERDPCTKFAIKLLISEIPLPKEAAEVEEFFSQKMSNERAQYRAP